MRSRADAFLAPWCSGLTCHPVTVEIVGSNPIGVASAKVLHLYRLVGDGAPMTAGRSGRLFVQRADMLPLDLRPAVASRRAAGETLRALAREYGVSREAIRRITTALPPPAIES